MIERSPRSGLGRLTRRALALLCAVVAGGCGGATDTGNSTDPGPAGGCDHDGAHYEIGAAFPAGDGCNTCACSEEGVGCTQMGCGASTCEHGGKSHRPGESFPAGDGCNTCRCGQDGSVVCTRTACTRPCTYEGKTYAPGESFPSSDDCNTCYCVEDGSVECTAMDCGHMTCSYGGKTYQVGETFPAREACNTCECRHVIPAGEPIVDCTAIGCACDPAAEWWREYVATSPGTCALIDYGCPANTTMFGNDCGCGCEQSVDCPEWFDCMEPSGCDVEAIKIACPYSRIAY
jgi:hypothetical protein